MVSACDALSLFAGPTALPGINKYSVTFSSFYLLQAADSPGLELVTEKPSSCGQVQGTRRILGI